MALIFVTLNFGVLLGRVRGAAALVHLSGRHHHDYALSSRFKHPFQKQLVLSSAKSDSENSFFQQDQDETSSDTDDPSAVAEAKRLRQQAKKLMAEAKKQEAALRESKSSLQKSKNKESDALIQKLFEGNATSTLIANRLREERWSKEQLVLVMDRLFERQTLAMGSTTTRAGSFQIGDVRNSAVSNETEYNQMEMYIGSLVSAAFVLDEEFDDEKKQKTETTTTTNRWSGRVGVALKTRLKELRLVNEEGSKRRLAAEGVNNNGNNDNESSKDESYMMGYMKQTLGQPTTEPPETNITLILEKLSLIPMWVPSSILPFVISAKTKLSSEDVQIMKDDLFMGTEFYCTNTESMPLAAVFRGNIRMGSTVVNSTTDQNKTALVFEKIQNRLVDLGLQERVQVFFFKDPEWRPGRDAREPEPRPVVLAIPKAVVPEQALERGNAAKILTGSSVALTIGATAAYSVACYSLNPTFFESIMNQNDATALLACIPIFIGVFALQVIHEVAHFFTALKSRIKIGLPVPIPSMQIGSFGCITPLRSFPPSRASLFDFALSGPMAQAGMSLFVMLVGVLSTVYASKEAIANFPFVPVALFKSSFLTGSMLTAFLPKIMLLPLSQPVPMHPLFMIGFAGLISSALNLLPVGRTDGGRACTAMFGSRFTLVLSVMTLLLLSILSLSGRSTISIFWGLFVILFQRQPEIPVRNEVTAVDDTRAWIYVASIALSWLTLSPFPGGGYL